jgi:hypothetical protein
MSQPQGHSAAGRIRSIKKIHFIGTRTSDLPACSTVLQPTRLPRAPKCVDQYVTKCRPLDSVTSLWKWHLINCWLPSNYQEVLRSSSWWGNSFRQHSQSWFRVPSAPMMRLLLVTARLLRGTRAGTHLLTGLFLQTHTFPVPTAHSTALNCCWPSPAQSFLVSGSIGIHGQILVRSNTIYVFENGSLLFERRGFSD